MFYICMAVIIFAGIVFWDKNNVEQRKFFIAIAFAVLFLYAALRDPLYSGDLAGYVRKFDYYSTYSLKQMLSLYATSTKNPTYHMLGWLFSRILPYGQAWVAFLAAIYLGVVSYIVFTESKRPALSFIIFLSLSIMLSYNSNGL